MDGDPPAWPGSIAVTTAEQAREAVRTLKSMGADFVKSYGWNYRPEILAALTEESRRQGLRIGGHLPFSLTVREAVDAGFSFFEHLATTVMRGCSTDEVSINREIMTGTNGMRARTWAEIVFEYARTCDGAQELATYLAKHDTWVTPTLGAEFDPVRESSMHTLDPRRQYISTGLWKSWDPRQSGRLPPTAKDLDLWEQIRRREALLLRTLLNANVPLLAGSDSGASNAYIFPGWSLHRELELLVQAGLTPLEALQTATRNPARYFGEAAGAGTIEAGKAANLLLLNGNPLEDIRNTRKIEALLLNGKLWSRAALDSLLADAAAKANSAK